MPPRSWRRAWKRATCLKRLSGLTLPHSALDAGAERWIASCRATHASPTPSPEKASERTTTGSLSTRSSASTTKAGLLVSSAKTSQAMRTDNLPPSFPLWKDWVAALRRESGARRTSAPSTDASDCSSWRTVQAADSSRGPSSNHDPKAGEHSLVTQVGHWPTPAARDHKGANSTEHVTTNGTGRMHLDQLPNFVEHCFSPLDQVTPAGPQSSPERRTLNPLFVEWLMGWPIGWTASEPAGTGLSHWLPLMRGALSTLCSPTPPEQVDLFAGLEAA